MIKLEWKLNGRSVAPGELGNELLKSFDNAIETKAKEAIVAVACPVHGTHATNIRATKTGDRWQFTYEACCERLKEAIATAE